jgi:hypothetical protein
MTFAAINKYTGSDKSFLSGNASFIASTFNRAVKSPLLIMDESGLLSRAFDSSDGSDSPPLAASMIPVPCDTPLLAAG